jgi:DNA-binding transcriptional LysR family regulator
MQQKIEAQVAGLGVGFLPRHRVAAQLAKGTLVELAVEGGVPATPLHLVWRAGNRGRALRWFIERLKVDEDS